jgi:lanthionine-containing peptide SapB
MALLDMQGMELPADGHHGGGSNLSLLLCDSHASVTLC